MAALISVQLQPGLPVCACGLGLPERRRDPTAAGLGGRAVWLPLPMLNCSARCLLFHSTAAEQEHHQIWQKCHACYKLPWHPGRVHLACLGKHLAAAWQATSLARHRHQKCEEGMQPRLDFLPDMPRGGFLRLFCSCPARPGPHRRQVLNKQGRGGGLEINCTSHLPSPGPGPTWRSAPACEGGQTRLRP